MTAISIAERKRRLRTVGLGLAATLLLTLTLIARTAFNMGRPTQNGSIDQTYLWANTLLWNGDILYHEGVDFPVTTGTAVLAVADGKVVDLHDGLANGDRSTLYGNYILVQHTQRHWDQSNGQGGGISYVYTMYLHLAYDSVIPVVGSNVIAGSTIALSDSTGRYITGQHLHFQVVVHPQANKSLVSLEPGTRPRNPELWLSPLTSRAMAIGKVTDQYGNPVPNLMICGLSKNGQIVPIRTYSFPWANPDDLLYENFGTTDVDVTSGPYHLYAREYVANAACGQTPLYRDLGNYTFTADRATYIGLYPSWLPSLRPVSGGWDVQTFVRNHATSASSAINASYFNYSQVIKQWRPIIGSHASSLLDPEMQSSYSALIVPNQDASVLALIKYIGQSSNQPAATTSISAFNGRGSLGWERAGTTLYVPLVKDEWHDRRTQIYVINTGLRQTTIDVQYIDQAGNRYPPSSNLQRLDLPPNVRKQLNPWIHTPPTPPSGVYSAVITTVPANDQPLAAVALEQDTVAPYAAPALYNAYSEGRTTIYAPLVKKNYGNNTSGITLQNVSNATVTFTASYYDMNGVSRGTVTGSIPQWAPYVLYNPGSVPEGFVGAVRVVASGNIVGEVSEENKYGLEPRLIYNMPLEGSTNIYLPLWYDNYTAEGGDWASGVNVHNVAPINNNITITWYNLDGTVQYSEPFTLSGRETRTIYNPPQLTNFRGSVWIRSTNGQHIVAASNIHDWDAPTYYDSALSFTGSNR